MPPADFRLPSGDWLDPDVFVAEAHRAVAEGVFTSDSIVDSYTHCFAVPVRRPGGAAAATLCLVAPKDDARDNHERYVRCLQAGAESLSVWYAGV